MHVIPPPNLYQCYTQIHWGLIDGGYGYYINVYAVFIPDDFVTTYKIRRYKVGSGYTPPYPQIYSVPASGMVLSGTGNKIFGNSRFVTDGVYYDVSGISAGDIFRYYVEQITADSSLTTFIGEVIVP
jgi:hypothetical protein